MNKTEKLLDKLKSDINDTKDIDNDSFVEQALTTLNELQKQLTLTDVVKSDSEQLKDKYVPNFEHWKVINKYTQGDIYVYDSNGVNYMNSDIKQKYINEILNL